MRNLFQVNVEEGRHLWAMVYLLVKHFGKDGREEAQALLERRSGQQDNPRILGAFNERTPDWLSFFMFTYFTDRDGKMQLAALAESGFDPLSRSCRFMLTEEAHHLFVGETGVGRTIEATCAAMNKAGITDPYDRTHPRAGRGRPAAAAAQGQLPHVGDARPVRQRDLQQRRRSLQLRPEGPLQRSAAEGRRPPAAGRHLQRDACRRRRLVDEPVPALRAINCRLLDDYIADCQGGIDRWNKVIEKAGIDFRITQPHKGFNRRIGEFAGHRISPPASC
jgi:benzoyl-CoA 2,3-dioxygenase component B